LAPLTAAVRLGDSFDERPGDGGGVVLGHGAEDPAELAGRVGRQPSEQLRIPSRSGMVPACQAASSSSSESYPRKASNASVVLPRMPRSAFCSQLRIEM
jgi:hypothetical protein